LLRLIIGAGDEAHHAAYYVVLLNIVVEVLISNIILMGRVHYLGRTSLGGSIDTTSTSLSPVSHSRVFDYPLPAGTVGHSLFAEPTSIGFQTYVHKQIQ